VPQRPWHSLPDAVANCNRHSNWTDGYGNRNWLADPHRVRFARYADADWIATADHRYAGGVRRLCR
jgi:hypothetical protein